MAERRRTERWWAWIGVGVIVGAVEAVFAVAFAALVFGGYLADFIADGISLYLGAAALTLAIFAWRGGSRGVIGGLQPVAASVLAVAAATIGVTAFGSPDRAFLTVVAATLVVTVLCGVAFLALGAARRGNLLRFVPVPVVGGFVAGAGWLLLKSGVYIGADEAPSLTPLAGLFETSLLRLWVPAFAFGVLLLVATRVVKRPIVIPAVLGIGLVLFAIGMLVTGSSIESARSGHWLLLGPFDEFQRWQPWTLRAISGADWWAVLGQWAGIATAVFVTVIAILFNIGGTEVALHRDLDTNEELRDAGSLNVISAVLGGIPGYHALGPTALAERMRVDARVAGLIAAAVPLATVVFGASVIELIPRMIVGGVLVFLGLAFLVEWVWDKRKLLPPIEVGVVLLILAAIVARGFLPGVVLGLVLAVVLFAVDYGRIELVREVAFGQTYHSNVDRPPAERTALAAMGDRVQILRVNGFVFFGSANGLLERIRKRVEAGPLRFLVIDLRRVTGVDSSAVVAFVKVAHLAASSGFELVFTGASEPVRRQLARGGMVASEVVRFEPDLDRGLQRCEAGLLVDEAVRPGERDEDALAGMPPGLRAYLERVELPEGAVLIRQDEPPDDVYVVGSGRLSVEMETADGTRMRVRTVN
ncbi:MAG TPA: SulP family inorganic anion transporter, partial [Actinomycetota bacterium]|nr:SulP family inorganic anion transporter [Actinomycetota bacterium]